MEDVGERKLEAESRCLSREKSCVKIEKFDFSAFKASHPEWTEEEEEEGRENKKSDTN